ncbi:MAG: hypothetical protein P1P64_06800 [Treponemataceae bacterium]
MKKVLSLVFSFIVTFFAFSQSVTDILDLSAFDEMSPNLILEKARASDFFSSVKIEILSSFENTRAGTPFQNSAKAKFSLLTASGKTENSLSNAEIIIFYPEQNEKEFSINNKIIKTDANGIASFSLPTFEYPLMSEVRFVLRIFGIGKTLDKKSKPLEFKLLTTEELEKLSAVFDCKVGGKKRTGLRLSINIVDFDENGRPFGRNVIATSLVGEFMRRGYLWPGIYESRIMKNPNIPMEEVLQPAKKDFTGNVNHFIIGRSKIIKNEKQNGQYEVTCEVTIQIWDIKNDILCKTINTLSTAVATTSSQAILKVRQNLGTNVLADLIEFGFEFQ